MQLSAQPAWPSAATLAAPCFFVQPASDLKIDVQADKDTYKPGSEAKLAS